jgi:hypothetical protein
MRIAPKPIAAYLTIFALLLWIAPAPALATSGDARLEGMLFGVDGRPAGNMRVHLIDEQGDDVAQVATTEEGLYSFRDLPAGQYSLGIENGSGQMAPVAAPPVDLGNGELARRDLKLMEADPGSMQSATQANYGLGQWWAGLTPAAKAWTVVAIVAVVAITASALSSETKASETEILGDE